MGIDFRRPRHIRGFRLGEVMIFGPGIGKVLVEKTVSGAIASFADGADDVPLKSASFGIVASGGGGTPSTPVPIVGASSLTVYQTGKNLLKNEMEDGTTGGVDYSLNSDGSIDCSGTVSNVNSTRVLATNVKLPVGSYVLSGADSSINLRCVVFAKDGTSANRNDTGSGVTVSITADTDYIEFRVKARTNAEVVSTTIYPMFEVGSTPSSTYEAYKSKTPITVALGQTVYGGTLAEDGTLTITHAYAQLSKDETWLYSSGWSKTNTNVFYTQARHEEISFASWSEANMLACNMLPVGSRNSISDADSNMLGTSGNVNQAQITVRIDKTICADLTAFNQFLTDNAIYYVYKLATPLVITGLEEISLSTYLGDNSIWCDSGDSEVTYYANAD